MFGLNGRRFFSNVVGHWAVHYQANPEEVWKRANLKETAEIISKSGGDIVGVIEVLEGQEKELIERLKGEGYKYFYIGKGHRTKYSHLRVQELVASKINGGQRKAPSWPVEHRLGGGGGFAHVEYGRFHLLLVHLGLSSRKYHLNQIRFLQNYLEKLNGKKVILGDFNIPYKNLRIHLPDLNLVSEEIKTCSMTPVMKWFYNKDVDHILVNGFKKEKVGFLEVRSDHKLVYADLE